MDIIIYGAQGYALGAYNAITFLHPEQKVMFFMVTAMGNNASSLCNLPVREIESVSKEFSADKKKNTEVLIATPESVHPEIEEILNEYGFDHHSCLTSERWNEMMRELYSRTGDFLPLAELTAGDVSVGMCVYMAKSHVDKSLKRDFVVPDYMIPIQVGSANTGEIIADVRDNIGDNISSKNANYCELTGLYWVWKNVLQADLCGSGTCDYYGFAQYRRMLMLSDEDLTRLGPNDVDVVLPYPLLYEPDINAHHERYLKEADWSALITAMQELQPEYAKVFPDVLKQRYMFNYNVILAKKEVLRDYCEWLFPILERTEELSEPKGCERADRYIGYMGETLETLYFMKNKDRLNIRYSGCRLLV